MARLNDLERAYLLIGDCWAYLNFEMGWDTLVDLYGHVISLESYTSIFWDWERGYLTANVGHVEPEELWIREGYIGGAL